MLHDSSVISTTLFFHMLGSILCAISFIPFVVIGIGFDLTLSYHPQYCE